MDESSLLYAPSHEWARIDGNLCMVGITRFAVEQLTDLVYVELPAVGKTLAAGQSFGVIESVKAVSDVYAPVAGTVIEANKKVVDDPGALSKDPYGAGWLIKLRIEPPADTSKLMDKATYDAIAAQPH